MVNVCHYLKKSDNLGEENLAAFVIFQTFKMVFFEIHQRFKGHFLNEMPVSFKKLFSFEKNFFSDKLQKFFRESIFFSLRMKKFFLGGEERVVVIIKNFWVKSSFLG